MRAWASAACARTYRSFLSNSSSTDETRHSKVPPDWISRKQSLKKILTSIAIYFFINCCQTYPRVSSANCLSRLILRRLSCPVRPRSFIPHCWEMRSVVNCLIIRWVSLKLSSNLKYSSWNFYNFSTVYFWIFNPSLKSSTSASCCCFCSARI